MEGHTVNAWWPALYEAGGGFAALCLIPLTVYVLGVILEGRQS
jgi:hypothetical protein